MSDKVIAVMNKPKDCENCVWGICKYSTPLSTRVKGYTCQLKPVEDRIVDCFSYDGEVHLENCPLISAEEHDKEIRDKAIEKFTEEAMKQFTEFDLKHGYPTVTDCEMILREIAEQMKEVGE